MGKHARLKGRAVQRVVVVGICVLAAVSLIQTVNLMRRMGDDEWSRAVTPLPVLRTGRTLWTRIADAVRRADLEHVPEFEVDLSGDPGCQNAHAPNPWVFAVSMAPEAIDRARWQWQTFMANVPRTAPEALLHGGRGIVLSGGRLSHLHTVVITITRLRNLGCRLPIELWFLDDEMPGPPLIAYFRRLGASVRCTCDIYDNDGGERPAVDMQFRYIDKRFQIKSIALVMSAFSDVLFLDSDNVPLVDPTYLFDHVAYRRTGAVLWPDFWACNTNPVYWEIMGLHRDTCDRRGTFESGQMLINKARHWEPLMLALEMNMQAQLHYNLESGSDRCGGGDKETFAVAFDALGHSYDKVGRQPGIIGRVLPDGNYQGTAMIQYDPDTKKPLFLHINTVKFSPERLLGGEQRRWPVEKARSLLGRDDGDFEKECLRIMVNFVCTSEYAAHAGPEHAAKCPELLNALETF
ncbi:Nucleotide-diphospho-sugar transferase domain-containing protein [Plasmodiophora brassicae]